MPINPSAIIAAVFAEVVTEATTAGKLWCIIPMSTAESISISQIAFSMQQSPLAYIHILKTVALLHEQITMSCLSLSQMA